jgi:hypothetical protein
LVSESEPKNGLAFWAPGTQIPEPADPRMALPCPTSRAKDTSSRMASLPYRAPHSARHLLAHILAPTSAGDYFGTHCTGRKLQAFSLPLFPFFLCVSLCFPLSPCCFPFVFLSFPLFPFVSLLFPFRFPLSPLLFPCGLLVVSLCLPVVSLLSPCCLPVVSLLLLCC